MLNGEIEDGLIVLNLEAVLFLVDEGIADFIGIKSRIFISF